MLLNFTDKSF